MPNFDYLTKPSIELPPAEPRPQVTLEMAMLAVLSETNKEAPSVREILEPIRSQYN